jgi:hypothetical protein
VDEFGNRVDKGPYRYDGGTATIRFSTPEEGLPRNQAGTFAFSTRIDTGRHGHIYYDPYVKANTQRYTASGTTTTARAGLYTFDRFMPLGPASADTANNNKDVVLTFEDTALKGMTAPQSTGLSGFFRPIPPITTATTRFLPARNVSIAARNETFAETPFTLQHVAVTDENIRLEYTLGAASPVRMELLTLLGERVWMHETGWQNAGAHSIEGRVPQGILAQGVYWCRVQAAGVVRTVPVQLVR